MINLKVTADGRELTIKKGKALVIGFPKNNQPDTMDLFYEFTDDKDNKTWVPDYNMFEAEAMLDTKIDSLQNDGDKTPSLNYPIEMTEDLYDYKFSPALMTATFYDLKLKGQDRTIIDYISDPESISDSIAKKFVENNWRVHYKFNIDKNGRIINLKVEDDKEHTNYNAYALNIGIDFLKKAPAFDIENYKDSITNEVLNYAWDYNLGFMGSKQINWDKFKERFREQFAEYKNKAIQKLDKSALDLYLFSATKMGWINCDKFWDTKDEKIDFFVKITDPKNTKVQIVFTDIKSIMNGEMEKDQVIFRNVPVNRKIKVIGISYSNGKPTLSYGLTKTTRSGIELGNFKEFTLNQLEEELNKVN
jgi:hypothetical protein